MTTTDTLARFFEGTHGCMEVLFFGPGNLLDIASGKQRSFDALQYSYAIGQWLDLMPRRKKRDRFLCIGCETAFSPKAPPAGFAIIVPFANRDGACVSGICFECANDHTAAALRGMRRIMPDCREVPVAVAEAPERPGARLACGATIKVGVPVRVLCHE